MLQIFHEEMALSSSFPDLKTQNSISKNLQINKETEEAQNIWQRSRNSNSSIITQLFQGETCNEIACETCAKVIRHYAMFITLAIEPTPIKKLFSELVENTKQEESLKNAESNSEIKPSKETEIQLDRKKDPKEDNHIGFNSPRFVEKDEHSIDPNTPKFEGNEQSGNEPGLQGENGERPDFTIYECLDYNMKEKVVDARDGFKCEKCGKNQKTGLKITQICVSPPILVFRLKADCSDSRKLKVEKYLNLKDYCTFFVEGTSDQLEYALQAIAYKTEVNGVVQNSNWVKNDVSGQIFSCEESGIELQKDFESFPTISNEISFLIYVRSNLESIDRSKCNLVPIKNSRVRKAINKLKVSTYFATNQYKNEQYLSPELKNRHSPTRPPELRVPVIDQELLKNSKASPPKSFIINVPKTRTTYKPPTQINNSALMKSSFNLPLLDLEEEMNSINFTLKHAPNQVKKGNFSNFVFSPRVLSNDETPNKNRVLPSSFMRLKNSPYRFKSPKNSMTNGQIKTSFKKEELTMTMPPIKKESGNKSQFPPVHIMSDPQKLGQWKSNPNPKKTDGATEGPIKKKISYLLLKQQKKHLR